MSFSKYMGSNMRFFLIQHVDVIKHNGLQGFRYDASCGMQPVEMRDLKQMVSKGDLVFFDFTAGSLPMLSFSSEFNCFIKELVLALGPSHVLDSVYFSDNRAEQCGLVSLRKMVQSIASQSFEPEPNCILSISSLVHLVSLSKENAELSSTDLQVIGPTEVEVFYKQVVNSLVDEKVSKGQLKSFGVSQSLIAAKFEELLERAYLDSDLKALKLICSLADKLTLTDLYQKACSGIIYLQLSQNACERFFSSDGCEVPAVNFKQYVELSTQHTVRAIAALRSFTFFSKENVLTLSCNNLSKSHPLDFAFSFLEDRLLLLGHEQVFVEFLYSALSYLNGTGKLLLFQVGAFDGVHGDFLHEFLNDVNCDAILIEPQSGPFEKLKANYKKAQANIKYVNKAISVGGELVVMYRVKSNFLEYYKRDDETYLGRIASFDKDYVVENIKHKINRWGDGRLNSDDAVNFVEEFNVETTSFENIIDFDLLNNREVVLQVDCEGFDYKVIRSFPLDRKRPALIHFESDKLGAEKEECFIYLRSLGYMLIEHGVKVPSDTLAIDLYNDIFIKSVVF